MKKIALAALMILLNVHGTVNAATVAISGTIDYEYTQQSGQDKQMTPNATIYLESDINPNLSFNGSFAASQVNTQPVYSAVDDSYLKFKRGKISYLLGVQSYTLGDGFIASMSGMNGIRTIFDDGNNSATLFYTKDNSGIGAADLTATNFLNYKDLTVDTSYFKADQSFAGVKVSKEMGKAVVCGGEVVKNLDTQAVGYQVTSQYGNAQKKGEADISLAYRNVEQGAVSQYSGDTNFDNSIAIRVGVDYKVTNKLTFSAFHDFARTQDNIAKNETNMQLARNF